MDDVISRQAAIDAMLALQTEDDKTYGCRIPESFNGDRAAEALKALPPALPEHSEGLYVDGYNDGYRDRMKESQIEPQWIPFKTRPLTEEEKEEHPEWGCILDCKLPDDGQQILVSVSVCGHERVQYDEFYTDDGSYLDSGYEIGTEAVAWMPLPKPYKGEKHEND